MNHFLKYAVGGRLLLILDGYGSHYNQSYDAKENVAISACLPTPQNSTPGHQCDYNRSLKQNWS